MTKDEFKPIAKKLRLAYRRDGFLDDKEQINLWLCMLDDYDARVMDTAAESYIRKFQYPPTIADMRRECGYIAEKVNRYRAEITEQYGYAIGVYPSADDTDLARAVWRRIVNAGQTWDARLCRAKAVRNATIDYVQSAERQGLVDNLPTWYDYLKTVEI